MKDVAFLSSHLWLFSYLFGVVWETFSALWLQSLAVPTSSFVHGIHLTAIGSAVWVVFAYWLISQLTSSNQWVSEPSAVDLFGFFLALLAISVLTDMVLSGLLLGSLVALTTIVIDMLGFVLVGFAGLGVAHLTLFSQPILSAR